MAWQWFLIFLPFVIAVRDNYTRPRSRASFTLRNGQVVPLEMDPHRAKTIPNVWLLPEMEDKRDLESLWLFLKQVKPTAVVFQDAPFLRPIMRQGDETMEMLPISRDQKFIENIRVVPAEDFHAHLFYRLAQMLEVISTESCFDGAEIQEPCLQRYRQAVLELKWVVERALSENTREKEKRLVGGHGFRLRQPFPVWKARSDAFTSRTDPWNIPLTHALMMDFYIDSPVRQKNNIVQAMFWCIGVLKKSTTEFAIDNAWRVLTSNQTEILSAANIIRNEMLSSFLKLHQANDMVCLDMTFERAIDLVAISGINTYNYHFYPKLWSRMESWENIKDAMTKKPFIYRGNIEDRSSLRHQFRRAIQQGKRTVWLFSYDGIQPDQNIWGLLSEARMVLLPNSTFSMGLDDKSIYAPLLLQRLVSHAYSTMALSAKFLTNPNQVKPRNIFDNLVQFLEFWRQHHAIIENSVFDQLVDNAQIKIQQWIMLSKNQLSTIAPHEMFEYSMEVFIWAFSELCVLEEHYEEDPSRLFASKTHRFPEKLDVLLEQLTTRISEWKDMNEDASNIALMRFTARSVLEMHDDLHSIMMNLTTASYAHYLDKKLLADSSTSTPLIILSHAMFSEKISELFREKIWNLVDRRNEMDLITTVEEWKTYSTTMNEMMKKEY